MPHSLNIKFRMPPLENDCAKMVLLGELQEENQGERKGVSPICQKHKQDNVLWIDKMKVKLFGIHGTAFHYKRIIPNVKHGGGSVMVWGCCATSKPGRIAITDRTMNSSLYQNVGVA